MHNQGWWSINDYHLTTDGSLIAGCGGWAFIRESEKELVRHGRQYGLSTNELELLAIVEGLHSLPRPSNVTVNTDSTWVLTNIRRRKYSDPLWIELYLLIEIHTVKFQKVGKGNPTPAHTRAHHLAREAIFNEPRINRKLKGPQRQEAKSSSRQPHHDRSSLLGSRSRVSKSRRRVQEDCWNEVPDSYSTLSRLPITGV